MDLTQKSRPSTLLQRAAATRNRLYGFLRKLGIDLHQNAGLAVMSLRRIESDAGAKTRHDDDNRDLHNAL